MQLPDDAEVSDEIWDEVIDAMKIRVQDKIPAIRVFAVRALSRFAIDEEDGGIIDIFLETLEKEQNAVCQINSVPLIFILDSLLLHLMEALFDLRRRSERQLFCLFHHQVLHWSQSLNQRLIPVNQFGGQHILCFQLNFPSKVLGEQFFPRRKAS